MPSQSNVLYETDKDEEEYGKRTKKNIAHTNANTGVV